MYKKKTNGKNAIKRKFVDCPSSDYEEAESSASTSNVVQSVNGNNITNSIDFVPGSESVSISSSNNIHNVSYESVPASNNIYEDEDVEFIAENYSNSTANCDSPEISFWKSSNSTSTSVKLEANASVASGPYDYPVSGYLFSLDNKGMFQKTDYHYEWLHTTKQASCLVIADKMYVHNNNKEIAKMVNGVREVKSYWKCKCSK